MWVIPESNRDGRAYMIVIIICLVLALLSIILRFWAKRITRSAVDASDLTCLASLVISVGLTAIVWLAYSHGWGDDVMKFTLEYATMASKIFPAIMIIWNSAVCMVRLSMLFFYIRLFHLSGWRIAFWTLVALNISSLIAIILSAFLVCHPFAYSYDKTIVGGYCGDILSLQLFTAIWNLLMDTAIVAVPLPIVWTLKMSNRKKIGVSFMFGMGIIICLMTLTRILLSSYWMNNNPTRKNGAVAFITGLEPIVGVINACLPHLPPVFKRLGSSTFGTTLSKVFNTGASKVSSQKSGENPTIGSYGRDQSHRRKSKMEFDLGRSSDSDTIELTKPTNSYDGNGILVRHDYSVRQV
ncbi:hypothetical protein BCR34DRAFT_605341 [Clohesyomyces aquaticus]|uniref:Rhodopsin domain-containing protein n=1 Tax=Clohesyomyces aquaticus TaxID=1231657 RepID=A0A1Y1YYM4_9PLEO|nr:hypothetical protein BCR34DRAFT_605341 [Clohesyomyces aquaticus]